VIEGTRKDKSDQVGEDLSTVVEENKEEINEANAKSKEYFRYTGFLLKLDDRGIL
jgi:hypothetical protein